MTTTHDLDAQLEAMFAAQNEALEVPTREWSDASQMAPVRFASRRRAYVAAFTAAAVTLGVVALGSRTDQTVTTNGTAATPAPIPATTPPRAPFHVETKQVALDAQALRIDLNDPKEGKRTFTTAAPLEVHSDPGTANEYTTLELTWQERDVEMRLNIYFQSDGRQWWSNEIRTYDGRQQGEWITYEGDFFRSPLGAPFVGDFEATSKDHGISGTLRLPGLRLEAFRRPAVCTNPTTPFALEAGVGSFEMPLQDQVAGYSASVRLLDTATCLDVADPTAFTTTWKIDDPSIATVVANGLSGDIQPKATGATAAHVTAVGRSGQVVSDARIGVRVVQPGTGPTLKGDLKPTP